MARPQVADEGTPPLWRVAKNILNKQLQTADKGWRPSLGAGRGADNSSLKNEYCYEMFTQKYSALD